MNLYRIIGVLQVSTAGVITTERVDVESAGDTMRDAVNAYVRQVKCDWLIWAEGPLAELVESEKESEAK